jgi:hypothetical protein
MKTYAWIKDTADSSKNKTIKIKYLEIYLEVNIKMKFPNNLIKRCPATIFAVRRIERVKGRIIFLTNSITTMKLASGMGVPLGTVWANILPGLLSHPNNIILNQIDNAVGKIVIIWAVGVNKNGNMEEKFKMKIVKNIIIIIFVNLV